MDPLLIVKTGTTFASLASECGDFADWIGAGMGLDRIRVTVIVVFEGEELSDPKRARCRLDSEARCAQITTHAEAVLELPEAAARLGSSKADAKLEIHHLGG